MKTELFVVSHKKLNNIYYPERSFIYVGPKQDEIKSINDYGDKSGISISERNFTYCECTAIYWLYKNFDCDYIGIEHYRRLFYSPLIKPVSKKYVEKKLKKYDFIVMINWLLPHKNKDQFIEAHDKEMYVAMEEAIKKLHPEYLPSFNKTMNQHHLSWCNMFITSKKHFNQYCDFLFDILFEIERNITIPTDPYKRRIMGFISERMLNIYLDYHSEYKVKQCLVLPTKRYEKR